MNPAQFPYECESSTRKDPRPPPAATHSNPESDTLYRVSGDTVRRADIISIAVTVYRLSALNAGKQEVERQIHLLFKSIGRPEPKFLVPCIEGHRYCRSRQSYGTVWFNLVTPDRKDKNDERRIFWFRLWE